MGKIRDFISHTWNLFKSDQNTYTSNDLGAGSYVNPGRFIPTRGNERSLLNAALNKIAIDCASVKIRHVKLDDNDRMLYYMDSTLNDRFTTEANIDQTGRNFLQAMYSDILDKGVVAVVPVETDFNPKNTEAYKIHSMRTADIVQWYPKAVRVRMYNDETGRHSEVTVEKKWTAIIENPMYAVMNDTNSTFQRLMRKLSILDVVDEQSGSGKLDMIIQLPYTIKSEARRAEARRRRDDLEDQIKNSKLGIAYTDATEKIIQLNRTLENNLLKQVEYLTNLFFTQLGLTPEIMNGTANEETMNNYYNRTIEPIVGASTDEFHRKFLTKTARTQKQAIRYFRDPFRLLPVNSVAEIADKFVRNEIMTANEIRQICGMAPSGNPKSDELRNPNMPIQDQMPDGYGVEGDEGAVYDQNEEELAAFEAELAQDGMDGKSLEHYASKYYDPVKAHEYYERTKQLKGKQAKTPSLNEEGRAIYKNVKENMSKEKKNRIQNLDMRKKQYNETAAYDLKSKISSLKEYYGQLSEEAKKEEKDRITNMIKNLRKENSKSKLEFYRKDQFSRSKISDEYTNKAQEEYNKIAKEYAKGKIGNRASGSAMGRYKKRFWVN